MKMTLKKGRRDFTQRLINYAITADVLRKCPDHAGSVYRTNVPVDKAYDVLQTDWQKGIISSDLDSAKSQLDDILKKAPKRCSHPACWAK